MLRRSNMVASHLNTREAAWPGPQCERGLVKLKVPQRETVGHLHQPERARDGSSANHLGPKCLVVPG
jgi:hypothetical protein